MWIGVVVSAFAFALAYNDGYILVYLFLGLFSQVFMGIQVSIWTSMITHVGMNTLVIIIQVLVQSGYSSPIT